MKGINVVKEWNGKVRWLLLFPPKYVVSFCIIFCLVISFGCANPWPSISVDTQGLGKGQLADYLRNAGWSHDEEWLTKKTIEILLSANKSLPSRASAESLGMNCASPPSKKCQYTGVVKHQAHGTPKKNVDAGKPTVTVIEITLPNYDEPHNIVVKKSKTITR